MLVPGGVGGVEEEWRELLRRPLEDLSGKGGGLRMGAEKRKRDVENERDVALFVRWFEQGQQYAEIKRVAGVRVSESTGGGVGAAAGPAGVGGERMVVEDDFLERLKKRHFKAGVDEDGRLAGTVLGRQIGLEELTGGEKGVVLEGGPVQNLRDWRPKGLEGTVR